jgi:hypothetical protein
VLPFPVELLRFLERAAPAAEGAAAPAAPAGGVPDVLPEWAAPAGTPSPGPG